MLAVHSTSFGAGFSDYRFVLCCVVRREPEKHSPEVVSLADRLGASFAC